ncbi:hypothetical protein [Thalassobius sp. I31.1]|uniref:hypothetical protein n=1 Tax=Thalassobius sp. I31.1 TaxID=2109912 RepID=UPI000D1A5F2C|nr:hypothetical protein [Thalassobius sp. I31.1]
MGLIRLIIFGFLGMTIAYWLVSWYSRSVRLERLEKEWDADPQGDDAARQAHLDAGMAAYENGFRKKLILLIYVVPVVFVITAFFVTNTN